MEQRTSDLRGRSFGHLTVVKKSDKKQNLVQCGCANVTVEML